MIAAIVPSSRFFSARGRPMSAVAFLNIAMHGHINPTLPVVAELVRRGHSVTLPHHARPFRAEIEATGAHGCSSTPGSDSAALPARRRPSR